MATGGQGCRSLSLQLNWAAQLLQASDSIQMAKK